MTISLNARHYSPDATVVIYVIEHLSIDLMTIEYQLHAYFVAIQFYINHHVLQLSRRCQIVAKFHF